MIGSIFVALSGMQGHQRALNVISNNVANMNTPGFRGSTVGFADVFSGSSPDGRSITGQEQGGGGLNASRTALDMRTGEKQQTGSPLDLFLEGNGFFVLQDENGVLRYTRNGHFAFVDGVLMDSSQKLKVMSRNSAGELAPVTLQGLQTSQPKATTSLTFDQNLSPNSIGSTTGTTDKEKTIDSLVVYDSAGSSHSLKVKFTKDTENNDAGVTTNWKISVLEGDTEIGTGELPFFSTLVAPGSAVQTLTLALKGTNPTAITFDFSTVTGFDMGSTSTSSLAVKAQDGYGPGSIRSQTFDAKGVLKLTYSNGQTMDGPQLVMAQILDEGGLVQLGDAVFAYHGSQPVSLREPADDLQVVSETLELSNVDLTQEFSELILMQRGYQASSQVVTTANDMLQQLLDMRSGR
jgi:flagellar hook protein FlgE